MNNPQTAARNTDSVVRNIADLLCDRIAESGRTVREVAFKAGMAHGTLERRLSSGPGPVINAFRITELHRVCRALKIQLAELVEAAECVEEPARSVVEVRVSYVYSREGLNPAGFALTVSHDDCVWTVHAIDEAAAAEGRRVLGAVLGRDGVQVA